MSSTCMPVRTSIWCRCSAYVVPRFGANGFLLGSNYIWGWETNRVARDLIADAGGRVLGERYLPIGETDVSRLIAEIQATRPDFILNNLIGTSSYAFIAAYAELGRRDPHFRPERCPILSCNLTECELPAIGEAGEGSSLRRAVFPDASRSEGLRPTMRLHGRLVPRGCGLCLGAGPGQGAGGKPRRDFRRSSLGLRQADVRDAVRRHDIDPQTQHATLPVEIGRIDGQRLRDGEPHRRRRARSLSVALRPRRDLRPPAPEGGVMSRASRIPNLGGAQGLRPASAASDGERALAPARRRSASRYASAGRNCRPRRWPPTSCSSTSISASTSSFPGSRARRRCRSSR